MKKPGQFNNVRGLYLFLSMVFLVSALGVAIAVSRRDTALASGEIWHGLYTDATSYAPGDVIKIHGSAPDVNTVFRLVRLDDDWTEITRRL